MVFFCCCCLLVSTVVGTEIMYSKGRNLSQLSWLQWNKRKYIFWFVFNLRSYGLSFALIDKYIASGLFQIDWKAIDRVSVPLSGEKEPLLKKRTIAKTNKLPLESILGILWRKDSQWGGAWFRVVWRWKGHRGHCKLQCPTWQEKKTAQKR